MKDQAIDSCMFRWVSYHSYSGNFYFFKNSRFQIFSAFRPMSQKESAMIPKNMVLSVISHKYSK